MHKDSNLRKRNALVIPGGLLAFYGILGILYAAGLRAPSDTCPDSGSLIWLAGACRSAVLVLAIPVIIGLALVAVGALAFRNRSHCRLGHGSWTHFGLALLISAILLPALALVLAPSILGPDAAVTSGGVDYPVSTILAGLTGVALLMLVPFAILYAAQARANPCCADKGCFSPCFCDEPAAEDAPLDAPLDAPAPAPAAVAETPSEPVVAPAPEPEPATASGQAETAAAAETPWETVPDEPAGDAAEWEVVPDEEPSKEGAMAGTSARPAPPLATRPTDPAAPPADAMALAAKWAEEDEQAIEELEGDKPSKGRKAARAPKKKTSAPVSRKPAKATKKAPAKKPKKGKK
jgi:hypothetical protein